MCAVHAVQTCLGSVHTHTTHTTHTRHTQAHSTHHTELFTLAEYKEMWLFQMLEVIIRFSNELLGSWAAGHINYPLPCIAG